MSGDKTFDIHRLCVLMEDHPAIWDNTQAGYADRHRKEKAWSDLAAEFYGEEWETANAKARDPMINKLRVKWRSARDQFKKELKNTPRSGDGASGKHQYVHFKTMLYLRRTMDSRPSNDSLPSPEPEAPQNDNSEESAGEGTSQSSSVAPTSAKKRRGRPTNLEKELQERQERKEELRHEVCKVLKEKTAPRDSADACGQQVSSTLRTLPPALSLAGQSYISFLLEMMTPPNTPYDLFLTLDQFKMQHNESMRAMAAPSNTQPQYGYYPSCPPQTDPLPTPHPTQPYTPPLNPAAPLYQPQQRYTPQPNPVPPHHPQQRYTTQRNPVPQHYPQQRYTTQPNHLPNQPQPRYTQLPNPVPPHQSQQSYTQQPNNIPPHQSQQSYTQQPNNMQPHQSQHSYTPQPTLVTTPKHQQSYTTKPTHFPSSNDKLPAATTENTESSTGSFGSYSQELFSETWSLQSPQKPNNEEPVPTENPSFSPI